MSRLRGFQRDLRAACDAEWEAGAINVMPVLPTGGGKTVVMGDFARTHDGYGCAIAHRGELVGQISLAMAREGIRHDIIGPKALIRTIVDRHMERIGRSYYDPRANWRVASVDTILRRDAGNDPWYKQVTLAFQDEGHHVLEDNKWGRAQRMFPNARGLFPTATPRRADRKGLGRAKFGGVGLVDSLVLGPDMQWMIDQGFLCPFEIHGVPPSGLNLTEDDISETTGDYKQNRMREEVKKSRIVGDVVGTYLKWARGKLGVTFAADIEHAEQLVAAYIKAGVPAAIVTGETPEVERNRILTAFERREYLQLVNVDLFGEGFDLPAIECVSFARPTASFSLYAQQFGRALRLMISDILQAAWDTYTPEQRKRFIAESSKPVALIFDHVSNVIRHNGPPTFPRVWSLASDNASKRVNDGHPVRLCLNEMCQEYYERYHPVCPYCGAPPAPPAERSKPEHVDGDITLYTEEILAALRAELSKVDGQCFPPSNLDAIAQRAIRQRHHDRQVAQHHLREAMQMVMPPSNDPRYNDRKFFHTFGVDSLTAKTLGRKEAEQLRQNIIERMQQ
jgi:DNA repair protein RadD